MTRQWVEVPCLKKAVKQFLENDSRWELVPVTFEDYYFDKGLQRLQYRSEEFHLKRKGMFGWIHFSMFISPDMACVWIGSGTQGFRTMRFLNDKILEAYNADKKK